MYIVSNGQRLSVNFSRTNRLYHIYVNSILIMCLPEYYYNSLDKQYIYDTAFYIYFHQKIE